MYQIYYEFENGYAHIVKFDHIDKAKRIGEAIYQDSIGEGTEIKEFRITKEK